MDDAESPPPPPILPHHTTTPKPKPRWLSCRRRTVVFSFLLLLTLLAAAFTLYSYLYPSILTPPPPYLLHSPNYYCHVTPFPDLCFNSMSATGLNASSLTSDPTPIFSTSIQVAIDRLNATVAATSITANSTRCRKLMRNSLSRLNESMVLFREGYQVTMFSFWYMDDVVMGLEEAVHACSRCLGVEEVKTAGVEVAMKCMENSLRILEWKQRIVADYYNQTIFEFEDYYWRPSYYEFDYVLLYCVFSVMYLFLGLLYYLLLRGD